MNECETRIIRHNAIIALIRLSIVVIVPCLFLYQTVLLYRLDNQLYRAMNDKHLYREMEDNHNPNYFQIHGEKEALPVYTLIKLVELSRKLEAFYFAVFLLLYPLSLIIDKIKVGTKNSIWLKSVYIIMFSLVSMILLFIIYTNLQYFSKTIMVRYNTIFYIIYAVLCNMLGLCFCVLMWSKFFDDIRKFVRFIINNISITINVKP